MPDNLPPQPISIRDTLFGDMPMELWPGHGGGGDEPWETFLHARTALASAHRPEAIAAWHRILAMKNLESRHYLQAWHFLRSAGEQAPPAQSKQLLGVVLEVPLEGSADLLAAYADRSARYYNHTGGGIVWDHPDTSLDPFINRLLAAAQLVLNAIGPWEKPRPAVPRPGAIRLNFLSPAGLHFGEGPFAALAQDPMAKPVIEAGIALMERMIEKGNRKN